MAKKKKRETGMERLAKKLNIPVEDVEKVVDRLVTAVVTPPLTVAVTVHPAITRPPVLSLPVEELTPSQLLYLAKQLRMAAEILQDEAVRRMETVEQRGTENAPAECQCGATCQQK